MEQKDDHPNPNTSPLALLPNDVVTVVLDYVAKVEVLEARVEAQGAELAELADIKARIPILSVQPGDRLEHDPRVTPRFQDEGPCIFTFLGRTPAGRVSSTGEAIPVGRYVFKLEGECNAGCALNGGVRDNLTGRHGAWPISAYEVGDPTLVFLPPTQQQCCGHAFALDLEQCLNFRLPEVFSDSE
jgi:hypothetical protein